jgi:MYXO-CTERM domain-containing protein
MKRAIKFICVLCLGIILASNPVKAQDTARQTTTTQTTDDRRDNDDDHGKWGLAGLLGLLGLLGLRKKDHHVEIHKNPRV